MMSKVFVCLVVGLTMVAGMVKAGPRWELGDDSWMKLSFLGQAHYLNEEDAAQQDDFYLRRGRFILSGQVFLPELAEQGIVIHRPQVGMDAVIILAAKSHWLPDDQFIPSMLKRGGDEAADL